MGVLCKSKTQIRNQFTDSAKSDISDAVVGSLLGHDAHGVATPGSGELAHGGPLVSLGIIDQHFCYIVAANPAPCNDESFINCIVYLNEYKYEYYSFLKVDEYEYE